MALHMCGDINIYPPYGANITCPENVTTIDPNELFYSQRSRFEVICELYIILILCCCGLFGNIMSIIVLRNDNLRREALFLLQALAVVDRMYIFVALWRYPLEYLLPDINLWTEMQPYVFPLLKTLQTTTIWMMVLVTTDRCV